MKIIRKNKSKFDCGIVAATNAAAWCNMDKSYEEVERVAKSCGYSESGIYFFQFNRLVKKLNIPAKRIVPKGLEDLENRLYSGKFFIFLYTPTEAKGSGHAVTAFMDHTGTIRVINPDRLRKTWRKFTADLKENGAKNFVAWEVPQRAHL